MVISFGGQHLPDLYNTRNVAQSVDRTLAPYWSRALLPKQNKKIVITF